MSSRLLRVVLLTTMLVAGRGFAADDEQPSPGFFMAPVSTDVHRELISKQADVYAAVQGEALVMNGKFSASAPLLAQLESEWKRLAAPGKDELKLTIRYPLSSKIAAGTKQAIQEKLASLARAAGFREVSAAEVSSSAAWKDTLTPVESFEEPRLVSEPIVENWLVKAYPVRTKLSKFMLGDVDCVVEIKRPFDGRQTELPASLRESIGQAVRAMDLGSRKGMLLYRLTSTTAGEKSIEQLFDNRPPVSVSPEISSPAIRAILEKQAAAYKPSPAMKLAMELGFERINYSHSPGGGAPEKLIGQAAPDFTLKTLQGKPLELSKYRSGRPALVTFWGVACGPCCLEAPHLTRMHAKYGDKLAIVAVNGYDETRETVARFVKQAELKHPIVLGGGEVAGKQYFVGAYPTTYWVSADGVVQDYAVGFDSAEALEERIQQLIGQ